MKTKQRPMKRMPVVRVQRPCSCEAWPFCRHQRAIDDRTREPGSLGRALARAGSLEKLTQGNPPKL